MNQNTSELDIMHAQLQFQDRLRLLNRLKDCKFSYIVSTGHFRTQS